MSIPRWEIHNSDFQKQKCCDSMTTVVTHADHMESYNKAAMDVYLYLSVKADQKLAEEVAQIILKAGR